MAKNDDGKMFRLQQSCNHRILSLRTVYLSTTLFMFVCVKSYVLIFLNENIVCLLGPLALTSLECFKPYLMEHSSR